MVGLISSNDVISQTDVFVTTYEDMNGNGNLGAEPTDVVVPSLWQDADLNGSYETLSPIPFVAGQFSNVPNGNYEIRLPATSGSYIIMPSTIANIQIVLDGTPEPSYEGGYYQNATIGNLVWEDLNGNGIQDGGEPGINGVSVNLSGTDGLSNPVNLSAVTAGGGFYAFNTLLPGDYVISFTLPSANHFFTEPDATADNDDSDADQTTGDTPSITLLSGDNNNDVDAGIYQGATISDLVWEDLNGNGIQDGGEPTLGGISVSLSGTDGASNAVNLGPIATNGTGNYLFDQLPPGTYTITFGPLPANFYFSDDNQTGDASDSDPDPLTGIVPAETVISNQVVDDVDAGVFEAVSIGDYVWEDMNGNGIQDGGEPPLDGVTVSISTSLGGPVTKADGSPAGTVTSGPVGAYLFDILKPGQYIITFENYAGYYRTTMGAGTPTDSDGDVATGDTDIITLVSGDTENDIDGGYFRPGSIGDFTWIDFNGDGLQNDPSSLAGVTIALTDNLGNPVTDVNGNPIGTLASGGAGDYSFQNLKPGTYKLTFTAPGGFFPSSLDAAGGPTDLTDATNDSDVDQGNGNMTFDIEIVSNEDELDIDGGFYQPVKIGNWAWHDANADGIQDAGEIGVVGVTVEIENVDGSPLTDVTNAAVAPEVTDATGMYEFMNIRPGNYNIIVTPPATWFFSDPDVGGDGTDSDFDMTGMSTSPRQINSNETLTDVDAGIYMNINLSGTVWIEQDDNGLQSGTENGAVGIDVSLITDPGGVVVGTNTTNASGVYMFSVKPGDYIVSVISSNFGSGNPLNGVISCTPTADPNNDVDLDDNGDGPDSGPVNTAQLMLRCGEEPGPDGVTNNTVDFCFRFDCGAQNNLSAPSCDMVMTPFCDLTILDAGCATMPSPPLVGNAPTPLCDGGGAPHNMSWFAFIAGTGNYEIEIVPYGCLPGTGGQLGIQAGIYTDCTFSNSVFCQNECQTQPIKIPSDDFIPGNTYYFWFDGCAGSVCSYEINVNGTFVEYIIPEPTEVVCVSGTCSPICPNNDITLQVNEGYENATLKFRWKVTSPSGVVNFIDTEMNTLDYTVTEIGTYTFEIISIGNICNQSSTIRAYQVVVRPHPENEDFGKVDVCENKIMGFSGPSIDELGNSDPNGDGKPGWQALPYTFMAGLNTATIMDNGCIYDQVVEINKLLISPPYPLPLVLCPEEIPYTISADFPFVINGPMPENTILLPDAGANGCDSLVNLEVFVLDASGEIRNLGCNNGITLFFLENTIIPDLPVQTTIRWRNPAGIIVNDGDPDLNEFTVLVSTPGTYTCEIVMELMGKECTKSISFDFNSISSLPIPQAVNWTASFCATVTQSTFTASSTEPNPQWVWTYPPGVLIANETTNTLQITWNGVNGGQVCVAVANNCGTSEPYCQNITVKPIPNADFDLDKSICVDSTASIYSTLVHVPGNTYQWSLDGGSIITTPGVNGFDSLEVKWSTSGKKIITLTVTRDGCISKIVKDSLTIVPKLTIPSISCNANDTSIEFFWTPLPGQVGQPIVTSSHPGFLVGNTYIVSGLLPSATVNISVTLSANHPCGPIMTSGSCVTQNCTPEQTTFSPIPDICLKPGLPTIDLKTYVTTMTPGGTYKFTGTGVTDEANGIFNPNTAGLGSHQITFVYKDVLDCFSPASFTTININETPTSTFIGDAIICQDSAALITYTGSITSGGTFTWDFGSDVKQVKNGPGPFTIEWNNPGQKSISLTTSINGCASQPSQIPVMVEPRIPPVIITCPVKGSTVMDFDWNDVPNTSGYELNLNGQPLANSNTSMISLNNLTTDADYTLIVKAISTNSCPGVSDTLTCRTNDCPPVFIKFSKKDTTLCQNANMPLININAIITGGLQSANQKLTWSGPGVIQNANDKMASFDPNVAGVGTHTIAINLEDGKCSKDTTMKITIIAKPVSTFTTTSPICISDNYIIKYTGTPNLPLDWKVAAGVNVSRVGVTNDYKVTFPAAGDYTIGLVTGSGTCLSDLTTKMVKVDPLLEPVVITCQQTTSSITFAWNDINCASQYQVKINSVAKGTQGTLNYTANNLMVGENVEIEIIPISTCACPAVPSSRVCTAKACPPVDITLDSPIDKFCAGTLTNPINLDVTLTGSAGTGTGTWSGNGITSDGKFDPTGKSPGIYKFFYDHSEENCDFRDSISIEIFSLPVLSITTTQPDCYSENFGTAVVSAIDGKAPYVYQLNQTNVSLPLGNLNPASYQMIVTDVNKCTDSESFVITGVTEPDISLSGNTTILKGLTTDLSATITGLTAQIDSIVWKDDSGVTICSGKTCDKITVKPDVNTKYCATVYYNNGCNVDDCIDVTVQTIVTISIPNIISFDGNNPTFFVQSYVNIKTIKSMKIYDRWGNNVFSKENIAAGDPSQGWNGKIDSKPVTPGVYVYKIEVELTDGKTQLFAGDVTVL